MDFRNTGSEFAAIFARRSPFKSSAKISSRSTGLNDRLFCDPTCIEVLNRLAYRFAWFWRLGRDLSMWFKNWRSFFDEGGRLVYYRYRRIGN
jgi:hypothetical protein